ncbi:MAG: hypothetical protein ACK4Z9_03590 [Thermodesulfovibrionales bacterium]
MRILRNCIFMSLILMTVSVSAEDRHTSNPLIEEMRSLDTSIREIVSAVATAEGERVIRSIETLHGLREKTHQAIKSGIVRLPRNQHRIKEFLKLDMKFHAELDLLLKAARKNNQRKMLILTNKLLEGCVNCHRVFKR